MALSQSFTSFAYFDYVNFAKSFIREQRQSLLETTAAPSRLAFAFALGTFSAFLPVIILDSLLVMALLARFRQVNKAAVFAARAVWNDFVVVPLYASGFKMCGVLLGRVGVETAVSPTQQTILTFVVGYLLLTLLAVTLSFGLAYIAARMMRRSV